MNTFARLCWHHRSCTRAIPATFRCLSETALRDDISPTMMAWQIHRYGGVEELEMSDTLRVPPITGPRDVLVEVHAASVNPIDTRMLEGYGSKLLNVMRSVAGGLSEFPLVLGRDFSGRVAAVGGSVNRFRVGDDVWGALPVHWSGSHSHYVVAPSYAISRKPRSLSHVEAAALPYAAATCWSALVLTGELISPGIRRGARVLVLGAAGGIGTLAVQLLKAWQCEVTATCASDCVAMVTDLGADIVVDYTDEKSESILNSVKGFDVILDCSGVSSRGGEAANYLPLLKPWTYAKFISLDPPLLNNLDRNGWVGGSLRNARSLIRCNMQSHGKGRSFRWAFFMPNGCALGSISEYVDQGKIRPVIQRVLDFSDLPTAYESVMSGHARGKTVLSMTSH